MMERLTQDGVDYCLSCGAESCAARGGDIDFRCPDYKRFEKLRAYERTGLEPEEIEELLHDSTGPLHKKLGEGIKAEAEGRLWVAPCKVGDVLYEVDLPEYGVIVCEVLEVLCINKHEAGRKDAPVVECLAVTVEVIEGHGAGSCYSFDLQDFGKTVFLTREEAEAARKEEGAI